MGSAKHDHQVLYDNESEGCSDGSEAIVSSTDGLRAEFGAITMKSLLRKVRGIQLLNRPVRSLLKHSAIRLNRLLEALQRRWPAFGLIDCEFRGIRFKLYSDGDDTLAHYFYYGARYDEAADLRLFSELSKSSVRILDIGANTGLYSILSSLSNPSSEIHAFEPYPVNAERLRINLAANGITNVAVVMEAMGEQVGEAKMAVPKRRSLSLVASANPEFSRSIHPDLEWDTIEAPVNTIDNYRKELAGPIDLIKCDVETLEISVFKGAYGTLTTDRPAILFECFMDAERRAFFNDILVKFNYFLYLILDEGVVYCKEGFPEKNLGMNFLISPVKPGGNFIGHEQREAIRNGILPRRDYKP